mmetsp:Transcript_10147/g.26269  ORF Transcript_10147/g.26269 Transcript_10147/m.26269 type:complete len:514 (+) Transcript_10147:175-1716(+)
MSSAYLVRRRLSQQWLAVVGKHRSRFKDSCPATFSCCGGLAFSPDRGRLYIGSRVEVNVSGFANQIHFLDFNSQVVNVLCTLPEVPQAMCCNRLGWLFVAASNKIFKVDFHSGEVLFVAGGGRGGNDASGESAGFSDIKALVIDGNDDLLVVDQHCIRKVALQRGEVVTVCGSQEAGHVDGFGCSARFNGPNGVCVDEDNNIYLADTSNHRIRKVRTGDEGRRWEVTTIAGDGQARVVDAQGTAASMASPSDVVCIDGWLYVVEPTAVRCVSPTGNVTSIAGSTERKAGYKDMVGADARFENTAAGRISSDGNGMVVLTDVNNKRLRFFRVRIESSVEIPPSTLQTDLEGLMSNEEATDLKIVVEGKPLYTLRGLLTTRSAHFKTMLSHGFSESSQNEIALREDSFEAVQAVLLFLHTDRLDVSDHHAVEVLRLSMLWELPRLQALTQDFITRRVTASSVCSFLSEANKHKAAALRAFCVRYIVLNFGSVQASGNFASLDKELLCEVIQSIRI